MSIPKFPNKKSLLKEKLLIVILLINIFSNLVVVAYKINSNGELPISTDADLYLNISYSIRNFSTQVIDRKTNIESKSDIGDIIMPAYPLLISPFSENLYLISIFQLILFSISLIYLYKVLLNKYLLIFVLFNLTWIILSTSWTYHTDAIIESTSISFLIIIIYHLDNYLKEPNKNSIIYFSILFGILIALNNRYIFHYCGILPFLLFLKFQIKTIKIKHLMLSFIIVTLIMAPWHLRQFMKHERFILFSPERTFTYMESREKDRLYELREKTRKYALYLKDTLNNELKNNPNELVLYKEAYLESQLINKARAERSKNLPVSGKNYSIVSKLIFEPKKKQSINFAKNDNEAPSNKNSNIIQERLVRIGIEKTSDTKILNQQNSESFVYTANNSNKSNSKPTSRKKAISKKEKSNNQKISELITKVNKINNTNFDTKNIALFAYRIDSIRLNNKAQFAKLIFDLINQADSVGLPDIKYSILGIPKPIDSTLLAKNSGLNTQNLVIETKSTKKLTTNNLALTTNVDSLTYFSSNLRKGLDEFKNPPKPIVKEIPKVIDTNKKVENSKDLPKVVVKENSPKLVKYNYPPKPLPPNYKDSLFTYMKSKNISLPQQEKPKIDENSEIKTNKKVAIKQKDNKSDSITKPHEETKIDSSELKPILVINKNSNPDNASSPSLKENLDSLIIFPVVVNNEQSKKQNNKRTIRYDTLDLATIQKISPDIEKLNIRKQVVVDDGRNRITIEDNKVAMIKVGEFENHKEFQKFENLRVMKRVAPYNSIIDALLENQPKFGESPEKLKDFLSDFSYDKYKKMVYDKPIADSKLKMFMERFKILVTLYNFDFYFVSDWDPRIGFPSYYRNAVYHLLDIIMIPLMLINIIPLFIAIYKRDWFIISMFVFVFLHLFLHALVNASLSRYTTTIYPVWITFAVYGYDQITRYLIHVYKHRADYMARVNRLLAARKA